MDVGVLGLGAMGVGMARNLIKAGHRVRVWNRSPAAAEALASDGATAVATPAEAAAGDAIVTMLADDAAVHDVISAAFLDSVPTGLLHIGCSTISVELGKELARMHADLGLAYVSAPVFGRPDAAAAGTLQMIVAGDPDAVVRARPIFDAVGQKTWPMGAEPFRANLVKLAGNLMIAAAIEAMAEAAALGIAHGIEPADMLDLYCNTLFACRVYQNYAPAVAERRFEPAGFKLKLGLKDVRLALAAGDDANVPLPFGSILRDGFISAMAAGSGDKDWSALADVALRRAGVPT